MALQILARKMLMVTLVCVTFAASPSFAAEGGQRKDDLSFFGARTIAQGQTALWLTAGLPDVEIGALYGLSTLADFSPTVRFNYGRGLRIGGGGATATARFRMKFAETHGWTIAVSGEPGLTLHLSAQDHPPTTSAGAQSVVLTPIAGAITADRLLTPSLRLNVGLRAAVGFFLVPESLVHTPIQGQVGVELHVTKDLFLLAQVDLGVDLYSQYSAPVSDASRFFTRVRLGLAWAR